MPIVVLMLSFLAAFPVVAQTNSCNVPTTGTIDYDRNDNGLIDICTLAQLRAIRWDLNGDGTIDSEVTDPNDRGAYFAAFPDPVPDMGCPTTMVLGCRGYELARSLDLNVTPYNTRPGWAAIPTGRGVGTEFNAIFEGNGYTISNLFINRNDSTGIGLFSRVGSAGEIRRLGLIDVRITTPAQVGALAAINEGTITASYAIGRVSHDEGAVGGGSDAIGGLVGTNRGTITASYAMVLVSSNRPRGRSAVGGLVGYNIGDITASYATGAVSANNRSSETFSASDVGGLVGYNILGDITASYATGAVSLRGNGNVGGLVGETAAGSVAASYATGRVIGSRQSSAGGLVGRGSDATASYWDTQTSGQSSSPSGEGKTTSELQSPAGYDGIYAGWNLNLDGETGNDNPWVFGTNRQYPVLRYGGLNTAVQFAAQPRLDPSLSALSLSVGTLVPALVPTILSYTADVAHRVSSLTVTAIANQSAATVAIRPEDADVATGHQVNLAVGANTITITVTAQDGTTTRIYTVTVTRAQPPGVRLSKTSLRLNEGENGTYTITLDTRPVSSATVNIVSDNPDIAATAALTFTANNWNMTQTVTVRAGQDTDVLHDPAILSHRLSGYGSIETTAAETVRIRIIDDDTTADVNGTLVIDAEDALILFYVYTFARSPAIQESLVRRLVGSETSQVLAKANAWQEVAAVRGGDINIDDLVDKDDALIMYYTYQFGTLLENNAILRRLLLNGVRGQRLPDTDTTYRQLLRQANRLR